MPIRKPKPTSIGLRQLSYVDYSSLSKTRPHKSLTKGASKTGARDNRGRISVRHRGGGAKRRWRKIDFNLLNPGKYQIESLEYDPNRSAFIMLVKGLDSGQRIYTLAHSGATVGQTITVGSQSDLKPGDRLELKNIPPGVAIHSIEIRPGSGGQLVRSAGVQAVIQAKDDRFAFVKLPSREIRKIDLLSRASVGGVSNLDHSRVVIGKAGRKRLMGWRPTVRGKAMHPKEHPHGGGEGVNPIGLKYPKTKWGKPARGVKTRRSNKYSDQLIVKDHRSS